MLNRKNAKLVLSFMIILSLLLGMTMTAFADSKEVAFKAGDKAAALYKLNVRAGAGMTSKVIATIQKGTEIIVVAKANNWYKVKLSNGKTGFVYGKYLKLVNAPVAAIPVVIAKPKPMPAPVLAKPEATMILATTTSTRDTGLLDVLVPAFDKKYGVTTKVVAVGSGEAIEMGKQGNADVLLVHSRKAEDEFVTSGYGVNRKDVMYNYFFLVGPKDDPAGILGMKDTVKAFTTIADKKLPFISRGDKSGTNTKELSIWTKANIKPQGNSWYMESGQGMGDTLTMASEKGAYTIVDSGTWFAFVDKVNLKIVLEGDSTLFNPYGVIAVSKDKYPNIHYNAAMAFVNFIISDEGQKIIKEYKKNGQQLFVPNATK